MIDLQQRARIFNALSDPTRLQIVEAMTDGDEHTGKEVAEQIGISLALLCHHFNTLQQAGLLERRKQGQCGYNRLNRALLEECLASLMEALPPA
jgi:DNA-binding transcriptional ArsR family regulator